MKGFLNQIFKPITGDQFTRFAPFLCFGADLVLIYYIKTSLLPRYLDRNSVFNLIVRSNPSLRNISAYDLDSFIEAIQSSMILMFTIVLVFNFTMYVLASRKKTMGVKFLYGYTLSTCILSLFELTGSALTSAIPFSFETLITSLIYLYVYLGMRHFKLKKNQVR